MSGFYNEHPEDALLLGDVVVGFQSVVPGMHSPGAPDDAADLAIHIRRAAYFAVMTPCCSVGNKQISIAPLVTMNPAFLKNPYFKEDLTRINYPGPPDKITPPDVWGKMSTEEQQLEHEQGLAYGITDSFVYAEDERLKQYDLRIQATVTMKTGLYLLQFGSCFRVDCDKIARGKPGPPGTKLLQLSVTVRQQLREKIKNYYSRTPDEDLALLGPAI